MPCSTISVSVILIPRSRSLCTKALNALVRAFVNLYVRVAVFGFSVVRKFVLLVCFVVEIDVVDVQIQDLGVLFVECLMKYFRISISDV